MLLLNNVDEYNQISGVHILYTQNKKMHEWQKTNKKNIELKKRKKQ